MGEVSVHEAGVKRVMAALENLVGYIQRMYPAKGTMPEEALNIVHEGLSCHELLEGALEDSA